jgi:hypothetical protein
MYYREKCSYSQFLAVTLNFLQLQSISCSYSQFLAVTNRNLMKLAPDLMKLAPDLMKLAPDLMKLAPDLMKLASFQDVDRLGSVQGLGK